MIHPRYGRPEQFANSDTASMYRDVLRSLAPDVLKAQMGMQYREQVKYVSWKVPDSIPEPLHVIHMTDLQFGHESCKYDRVIEYRDWILAEPNRFCVFGGDLADCWGMISPGSPFEQLGDPQSQIWALVKALAPMRHRVLGYVGGNHERRGIPCFGDLGVLIATLLQIPYSKGQQFIDINYGRHTPFKISMWHGVGGARTKGTVAQNLHRFMADGDSQLYLVGHYHQPMIIPMWKTSRDIEGRKINVTKCVGAVSSSFLETWNTYGEVKGFGATDVLMACAKLEKRGKWAVELR